MMKTGPYSYVTQELLNEIYLDMMQHPPVGDEEKLLLMVKEEMMARIKEKKQTFVRHRRSDNPPFSNLPQSRPIMNRLTFASVREDWTHRTGLRHHQAPIAKCVSGKLQ